MIPQLEPLASDFNELASVVGPAPADIIEAARKHLVVEIEAATNHLVWHQHEVVGIDDLPVAMTFYPELQVISEIRAAGRPANKLQEKGTLGIGVIMSRKPFVVQKSARPIPPQMITEEPDPDDRVSSYCPKSGPTPPAPQHHPIARAEGRRRSFRPQLRRNPKRPVERWEQLPAGRRVGREFSWFRLSINTVPLPDCS